MIALDKEVQLMEVLIGIACISSNYLLSLSNG